MTVENAWRTFFSQQHHPPIHLLCGQRKGLAPRETLIEPSIVKKLTPLGLNVFSLVSENRIYLDLSVKKMSERRSFGKLKLPNLVR